jgi:hypothetical protein
LYKGVRPSFKTDNTGFIDRHMPEIEKLIEVQSLSQVLQSIVDDHTNAIKNRKIVSDYLNTLFLIYADSKSFPDFNDADFRMAYVMMEEYMYGELEYHHYTPLYSFDMTPAEIKLVDNFVIRKIEPEEYNEMLKMGVPVNELIFMKYLIQFHSKLDNYEQKKSRLELIIFALRLFKTGTTGHDRIYTKPALTHALGSSSEGSIFGSRPRGPLYALNKKEASKFTRFYISFSNLSGKIQRQKFLQIAIGRFTSAFEERNHEDKIIDLAIALEALFSTSSEDLTYKLKVRISVLLARNDSEADFLFDFIGKAYSTRSKLVHGKVDKESLGTFSIGAKKFSVYDIAAELERITRLSILKILTLFSHDNYRSQDDIIDAVDRAAIGSSKKIIRQNSNGKFDT